MEGHLTLIFSTKIEPAARDSSYRGAGKERAESRWTACGKALQNDIAKEVDSADSSIGIDIVSWRNSAP